ncbi:MAG: hypothetical protein ACWA6U_05395 [Breznakibacter sp.]
MNLDAKKLELVQLILNIDQPKLLERVSLLIKKGEVDWWDDLPLSVQQSIDNGLADANHGKVIPHQEIMNEIKQQYGLRKDQ